MSDEKKGLVPKLRFPEFWNATAWENEELGKFATDFLDGDWIESKDQSDKGVRLLQTGNVGFGEFIDRANHARFVSNETFDSLQCTEVLPGDGLISRLPDPVGRMCIVPELGQRMITAVDCTILRFKNTSAGPYFFLAYSVIAH